MQKKPIIAMTILATLLVVGVAVSPTNAAVYTNIGVKQGDTTFYSSRYNIGTVNSTFLLVTKVAGTFVNLTTTDYLPGGVYSGSTLLYGNVSSYSGGLLLWLTATDLNAGDPIADGSPFKVNETVTMTVAGASRSVNHAYSADHSFEVYYDRATGILVKGSIFIFLSWYNHTMLSTNIWQPDTPLQVFNVFSFVWLIGGLVVGFAVAALLMRGKHKK